ncbi:MAG: type II secretion system F family protein [Planctomycetota bacterium]
MNDLVAVLAAASLGACTYWAKGRIQFLLVLLLSAGMLALPIHLIIPVLLAIVLPQALVQQAKARALARLDAALPPFLENLAHAVRSGISLEQAFRSTLPTPPGPLGPLATETLHGLGMGLPFEGALRRASDLLDTPLTRRLADAVELSRQGGIDVSRLVEALARQSREEAAAASRLAALSAQGRLQTLVLALLPPAILLLLQGLDPERMHRFFAHPTGRFLLAGMVLLEIVGILWMRRLTRV